MRTGNYSTMKALHWPDRLETLRGAEMPAPVQIQLIISDLCNHDCSFCAYRLSGYTSNQNFGVIHPDGSVNNNPKRFIPKEKCFEIIEDATREDVEAFQFTGGGEPTVHPDHMEIFSYALDHGRKCALVTNGNILRNGWDEILPRFSWIRVSLDAGTPGTYASIRKTKASNFSKAIENAQKIHELGKNVGVSFVLTKENFLECFSAARAVREAGLPSIRFAAMFSPSYLSYYDNILSSCVHSVEIAKELETDDFKVIDMFSDRVGDLRYGRQEHSFCGYQFFNMYIGGDLKVYRCCNTAYNDLGEVGSLENQSLSDFLYDPDTAYAYHEFDAKQCANCAFNKQNEAIRAAVIEPPHVEFV